MAKTLERVKMEFYYAFESQRYPGTPILNLQEISDDEFEVNGIRILTLPVLHLKMPVLGFRIGDFSYITDANFIPEETFSKLKGTKILVLNALQKSSHLSHFNLEEAIAQAKRIGAEQTYFTHMGHRMGLHQSVSKELPASMALAHDGLSLTV